MNFFMSRNSFTKFTGTKLHFFLEFRKKYIAIIYSSVHQCICFLFVFIRIFNSVPLKILFHKI